MKKRVAPQALPFFKRIELNQNENIMNNNTNQPMPPAFSLGGNGTIDIEECFNNKPEPLDFVIPGLLRGSVGAIVAAGSTGKSYLALGILADLATGKNQLGLDIKECEQSSVYLTLEDPREVLAHRFYSLGALYDNPHDRMKINNRVHAESQVGQLVHLVDQQGLYNQALLDGMIQAFMGKRLIILDTMRRFHSGDENLSSHMAVLISCFERIAHVTGAAILFLHHVNKASGGGEQTASRGSSAITDNIRCQINLIKMSDEEAATMGISEIDQSKFVQVVSSKVNYLEKKGAQWLKRKEGGVLAECNFEHLPTVSMSEKYGGRR